MKAVVNIICYKQKTLKNGEHPIMIRVAKQGKTKYKSLGISVHPDNWDFQKNRPLQNCPNRELILKIILENDMDGSRVKLGDNVIYISHRPSKRLTELMRGKVIRIADLNIYIQPF